MNQEIGPIAKWEVIEYYDTHLVMVGYDEDGQSTVKRHFELEQGETRHRNENGAWEDLDGVDDGGFPIGEMFTTRPEPEQ